MGEVYAAEPVDPGPRVALKILRREFFTDSDVRSRFLEEGRTCMRLVHPNIVRVLECAQAEDGSPYIAMELLEGVPLGAYMSSGARISVAQAAPILQSILAGLGAAHASGIVHRDLKPDNVFLNRDRAGAFVVKVLDFGISKVMDVAGGMGQRTRTGMLLGTPAYMSPEQARSARAVDQRADLWSAGVLFYEMLTGRSAFPAPNEYARLAAVLSVEPEPVERIDPSLAPLSGFFERALKKDREERFASAAEMAQALAAALPKLPRHSAHPGESAPPAAPGRIPEGALGAGAPVVGGAGASVAGGAGASIIGASAAAGPLRPSRAPSGITPSSGPGGGGSVPGGEVENPEESHARGSTLASAGGPRGTLQSASPQVLMAPPAGANAASKGGALFGRQPRGRAVPVGLVVVLVLCALSIGFLLGWSFARMA
jgi:eukaryotic-like serine/threonine-protein kinase